MIYFHCFIEIEIGKKAEYDQRYDFLDSF